MGLDKKNIINALNTSVTKLQRGIDTYCCLVASMLEEKVDERNLGRGWIFVPNDHGSSGWKKRSKRP